MLNLIIILIQNNSCSFVNNPKKKKKTFIKNINFNYSLLIKVSITNRDFFYYKVK